MLVTFQVLKYHMWLVATHWLALLQNVSIITGRSNGQCDHREFSFSKIEYLREYF